MDDQVCPKCKTTRYRNPSMKLMVNVCGHNICDSCVELLFVKGSGSCPECQIPLRRVNFRVQLFDDSQVDKEVDVRRKVLRDFNKKEEDFDTLKEFNDYLEMVEDIIFNLSNDIDVVETNKRITDYKELNKDFISRNRHKISYESMELEDILMAEAKNLDTKRKEMETITKNNKLAKLRHKEQMIDELMFSDSDANSIVDSFNSSKPAVKFSTGIEVSGSVPSLSSSKMPLEDLPPDKPYIYEDIGMDFEGPKPPTGDEEIRDYCRHIRAAGTSELAGGYVESIACFRALQEAMSGLFYSSNE